MMNFFGGKDRKMGCGYMTCGEEPGWNRTKHDLPADGRKVYTLVFKDRYGGSYYTIELQKFDPEKGWENDGKVVAWKDCEPELLMLMAEKR